MRIQMDDQGDEGIGMSPLIDCVFLLLIFFLVTTMLKRSERQIPLQLPDASSSLSDRAQEDAQVIAVNAKGAVFALVSRDVYTGRLKYATIKNLEAHLNQLDANAPLEIAADEDAPMEQVIAVFDACQLQGFKKTRVRMGGQIP